MKTFKDKDAFILLDAIMGIVICATALSLAFSFLYTFTPKPPSTYDTYKELFINPTSTPLILKTQSNPTITYNVLEQTYINQKTLEKLRFYIPIDSR